MAIDMILERFRVTNFRSVEDSGWIDVDDVTALIGTNESGKSNLLLPLWKLNPAKEGEIHPTSDFPRKHFTAFRSANPKPIFIEAEFMVRGTLRTLLASETGFSEAAVETVTVRRRLDGKHEVYFPRIPKERTLPAEDLIALLDSTLSEITSIKPMKAELVLTTSILAAIETAKKSLPESGECDILVIENVIKFLSDPTLENAPKTSKIVSCFKQLKAQVKGHHANLAKTHPRDSEVVTNTVLKNLPLFVYYSNYGNLDSEIYLPHVIQNLARQEELGQKEGSKARTLKVLFEFVSLKPDEILTLGRDTHAPGRNPTQAEVEQAAENKKERSILLQSASTRLTEEFRKWWKQGNYRFRFEADGDHFRIWVADDRRPEEVELEGRSTGLQWFLSFYLIFLVESHDAHSGCILLLDEPGHSLHPLAQRDLSEFFDGLAERNQLLYTTHSPFLVDADRLDRARKVFIAPDGTSKATSDLGADGGDPTKRGAGYAVHAALGLSVAEGLMIGCEPVIVEGPSDQHYLTAIKTILIRSGLLKPGREFVFPPAGGAKGIKAVASILGGRDEVLPVALLDSDVQGTKFANELRVGLYSANPERVLQIGSFVDTEAAEIEDLIPADILVNAVDRMFREPENLFKSRHDASKPIIPQIESWAKEGGAILEKGWKASLAIEVKRALLKSAEVPPDTLSLWQRIFEGFKLNDNNAMPDAK